MKETGEFMEGAPVYSCPGCDTQWIELNERKPVEEAPAPPEAEVSGDQP